MRRRPQRLTVAAAALTLTAALLATLAAGPGGAQTPTRFFFVDNLVTTTDANGYIMIGLEGEGNMSCDGAAPIFGAHTAAQVVTRQPLPGSFLVRVWNDEGEPNANVLTRIVCTIDVTFTEPTTLAQAKASVHASTPTAAQLQRLSGR
jgi:hypothetical protein